MTHQASLFDQFGGIRPMARKVDRPSSTIMNWKSEGRIPSQEQPHVLAVARAHGLPITAEDVVFPLGRPAEDLPAPTAPVACDPDFETQTKDAA